jgi:chromate transporter
MNSRLPTLFVTFLKIGLFTFGGGYAMIPIIEREIVKKRGWIDAEEVTDVFAVAQAVPGAIAINSSTFVGYKVAGRKGAVVATIGIVLPSLIVITLIAAFFGRFQDAPSVKRVFLGIRSCVVALIAYAGLSMARKTVKNTFGAAVALSALVASLSFDVDAIAIIAAGILLGIGRYFVANKRKDGAQ